MGASNDPVYLRVLEDLRDQIRGGALAPGARVPSRNGIIARYGVGETAAKHALQVLAAEGLIEARAGSGSYVRRLPAAAPLEHDRLHFPGSPFGLDGPWWRTEWRGTAWRTERRTGPRRSTPGTLPGCPGSTSPSGCPPPPTWPGGCGFPTGTSWSPGPGT